MDIVDNQGQSNRRNVITRQVSAEIWRDLTPARRQSRQDWAQRLRLGTSKTEKLREYTKTILPYEL
jgi:hypothetical protein